MATRGHGRGGDGRGGEGRGGVGRGVGRGEGRGRGRGRGRGLGEDEEEVVRRVGVRGGTGGRHGDPIDWAAYSRANYNERMADPEYRERRAERSRVGLCFFNTEKKYQ